MDKLREIKSVLNKKRDARNRAVRNERSEAAILGYIATERTLSTRKHGMKAS